MASGDSDALAAAGVTVDAPGLDWVQGAREVDAGAPSAAPPSPGEPSPQGKGSKDSARAESDRASDARTNEEPEAEHDLTEHELKARIADFYAEKDRQEALKRQAPLDRGTRLKRYGAVFFAAVCLSGLLGAAVPQWTRPSPAIKDIYLAADEVEWDYAPRGTNCKGTSFEDLHLVNKYKWVGDHELRIGSKYIKARYVEYTGPDFAVPKPIAPEDEHLNMLGPTIRAEVGEIVRIHFRNNARFPFSVHPFAVHTHKHSEGAEYRDGTPLRWTADDAVQPFGLKSYTCEGRNWRTGCMNKFTVKRGETLMLDWPIEEAMGPSDADGDSVVHLYTSAADGGTLTGLSAGLVGALIVAKPGASGRAAPDREFVNLYTVTDENFSPYLEENIWRYITKPSLGKVPPGWVSFGALDKGLVLQALVWHASRKLTKISLARARELVEAAVAAHERVEEVDGLDIRVWFDKESFDPHWYDAANGGVDAAAQVVHALHRSLVDAEDPKFMESNRMHGINGRVYCNLDLRMKKGERVRWYVVAAGTERDVHTPHWHGNTLLMNGRRVDELEMLPGTQRVLDMQPENVGTWMYHCHVNDHIDAGMTAVYTVEGEPEPAAATATREYFLAAEDVDWDYWPSKACGGPLPTWTVEEGPDRLGTRYAKTRFVEYTGPDFATKKPVAPEDEHLQLLGPALRAEVGDSLVVHFKNLASSNYSLHPHGVFYSKHAEGFRYADGSPEDSHGDDAVAPGDTYTYVWPVPETAGPGPDEGSSKVWLYHSHVSEVNDTNAGLIGAIVVTRQGLARSAADPRPKDVDREFVLLFTAYDETWSQRWEANAARLAPELTDPQMRANELARLRLDGLFLRANRMSSLNGRLCELPGLEMDAGDVVRWHLVSMGNALDVHAPTWSGHTLLHEGRRTSTMALMPATMHSADMVAVGGTWELFDHVTHHYDQGIRTPFVVRGGHKDPPFAEERVYYVAADEVEWDYAPGGKDGCTGQAFDDDANVFLEQGHHRIGPKYVKALFREYFDETFERLRYGGQSRQNPASEHLGLLGPVLRGKVGDKVTVVLYNRLRFKVNMVFDALPGDSTPCQPGETRTYSWVIGPEAGPGPDDPSTVSFLYYSNANGLTKDTNAGLVGVAIVGGKDTDGGRPQDVQREFITLWAVFNEGKSLYRDLNIRRYAGEPESVKTDDPGFKESNKMHSLNGFMYCTAPGFDVRQGQRTRWYVHAIGSDHGMHTPRWFGQSIVQDGSAVAVSELLPGQARAVDMLADSWGTWLFHCEVHDHHVTGMKAHLNVDRLPFAKRGEGSGFVQWTSPGSV